MKKVSVIILFIALICSMGYMTNTVNSEESQRKFTGTKKCKMCHNKAKSGGQFKQWESTTHSKAYETLASAESKEIAKKMGIEDPQKSDKCLKCHVTAFGVDAKYLDKKFKVEDGVSCESCHGAGGDYWKKKVMVQLSKGEITPESVGLTVPTEAMCVSCHNEESPTYKEFKFDEMYKKISHPLPEDYKKANGYK